MRTLVATALVAYARADETSLMQDSVKRSNKLSVSADSNRADSTKKLLDTAVNMIKNGVTPDVITFVDATVQDIDEEVLVAIQSEHDIDQAYINSLCQDFMTAVQALEDQAAQIAVHDSNRLAASEAHHTCRADEAHTCAKSRRCEEQLREKWRVVKHEESVMREIHGHIHDEWCIHPPFFAHIDDWLSHPFNWAQTSPYPLLDLPQDVRDFRHVSVTHFTDYMEQKIVVERAWLEYNEKLEECAILEAAWEDKVPVCDQAQITLREHACEHSTANRQAREAFGQEWDRITALFEQARIAKTANEADRKNEWETLKIVTCLLNHVHSSVITSIETGGPCPTIDSDPDGVTLAIEDCHIVTRGCGEDSMTAHLCLDWCEPPPIPPLPPVEAPACTPAYVAKEQAQFLAAIQATYTAELAANSDYPNDPLTAYETGLSAAGWAGCAPPLVCVDCSGSETQPPCLEHTGGAHTCHVHEEYLTPGQSNSDSFRCLDGTCIMQAGRCNGANNCADGSDEAGCDAETTHFVPAYLTRSSTCPDDFHDDVHFRCGNGDCIEKVGLCNGEANCADGSDEAQCTGGLHVTVEATSGRTITVESLQSHTGVFHDREYNFDSLGHFQGKTFIKYSNDDKMTDNLHVMTKLRTLEPATVFIVKLDSKGLPWLETQGYTPSSVAGVSFSGVRETRHKEWDPTLLTTDHFAASSVYSKTFPAGTISIPGNNGGDGSFLIFMDKPGADDEFDSRLTAYWEEGNCGVHGNDQNWQWCGQQAGDCALTVATDLCPSGEAELAHYHGTGAQGSYVDESGCRFWYLAQYRCAAPPQRCFGNSEDACREAASAMGLELGGVGYEFGGDYQHQGCYSYTSGQYQGHAYYGRSGTVQPGTTNPLTYRVPGTECQVVSGEAEFIGCFVDDGARDLGAMVGNRDNSATNTFELCRAACGDSTYMALQYGGECFCSNSYANGDQYVQVDESECNAVVEPCRSSSYNCGGTWRQAIYQIGHAQPDTCVYQAGDGVGGTESYIGDASSTAECEAMVRAQCPTANGATIEDSGHGRCYCEFGMTSWNSSPSWQSCMLSTAEWTVVQGAATSAHAGVNLGADAWNTMFAACPVVRYTNPSMTGSPAVYARHGGTYPGDAQQLFTHLWAQQDNQFHTDFDIYPSVADARAGTNPWQFCNFADQPQPNHFTVGFPRDCGPAVYQPHIWFHATRASGLQTQGYFEIYTGRNCPV